MMLTMNQLEKENPRTNSGKKVNTKRRNLQKRGLAVRSRLFDSTASSRAKVQLSHKSRSVSTTKATKAAVSGLTEKSDFLPYSPKTSISTPNPSLETLSNTRDTDTKEKNPQRGVLKGTPFRSKGAMRPTPNSKQARLLASSRAKSQRKKKFATLLGCKSAGKVGKISGPALRLQSSIRAAKERKSGENKTMSSPKIARKLGKALAKAAEKPDIVSPGQALTIETAIQTPSGRKVIAKNLAKAMDKLIFQNPSQAQNVDKTHKPKQGDCHKNRGNDNGQQLAISTTENPEVDSEVHTLTSSLSSAFSKPQSLRSAGLPRQRSHDALAQTLTVQSRMVDPTISIRAFCDENDSVDRIDGSRFGCVSPAPGKCNIGLDISGFPQAEEMFDKDQDSGDLPHLSFSANRISDLLRQPTPVRGTPSPSII